MQKTIAKHADKLRFALVGGVNTAIDFGILFGLVALGLDKIPSNFISTSFAFLFSFFANKSYTFKDKSKQTKRQFVSFLVVTLFGLWVLQPIVISLSAILLTGFSLDTSIVLLIGKLLATLVTLVWNYLLYRKFVFKREEDI